jgi:hypothetical protein
MIPVAEECRECGRACFSADDTGPIHPCCKAWRNVIQAGYHCPACQAGEWLRNPDTRNRTMPPLPRTLPDGTPFSPDIKAAETVYLITRHSPLPPGTERR